MNQVKSRVDLITALSTKVNIQDWTNANVIFKVHIYIGNETFISFFAAQSKEGHASKKSSMSVLRPNGAS